MPRHKSIFSPPSWAGGHSERAETLPSVSASGRVEHGRHHHAPRPAPFTVAETIIICGTAIFIVVAYIAAIIVAKS